MVKPLLNKAFSTNIKKLLLWIVCYEQQQNSKILIKSSLVKIIYVYQYHERGELHLPYRWTDQPVNQAFTITDQWRL